MADPALDIFNDLPGRALVPLPVQGFGREPELDDEIAGQVFRLGLAAFLAPEPQQGGLVVPMIIRASEPPMKLRRPSYDFVQKVALIDPSDFSLFEASFRDWPEPRCQDVDYIIRCKKDQCLR